MARSREGGELGIYNEVHPDSSLTGVTSVTGALDRKDRLCDVLPMPKALEEVTKDALELAPDQRLALAEFLIESADASAEPNAEAEWEVEIRERIRAIDEGRVAGISYEEVMREAERRLAP